MVPALVAKVAFYLASRSAEAGRKQSFYFRVFISRHSPRTTLASPGIPPDRRAVVLPHLLSFLRDHRVEQRRGLSVAMVQAPCSVLLQQAAGHRADSIRRYHPLR